MDTAVVVTGATGWLGTRLLAALREGLSELADGKPRAEIRCLVPAGEDAAALETDPQPLRVVRGDLCDPEALHALCGGARGGALFHCAGLIHPRLRTRELFRVNVEGTRHLLDAAAACGLRRAVVVSSNSPFGTNPSREHRFDERSPYRPYMAYGRSKMEMERVVAERARRGDLETVVLRAPWFYGPPQPERQTAFFRMIRAGAMPIVGDGGNLRSMAYVDNLVQGLLLAERAPHAAGETYWIADRRPYSMNEIVDTIERLMADELGLPVRGRRIRLPAAAGRLASWADAALQACGLYAQRLHVFSELGANIACSVARAERELGYRPAVELEEGMRRSLAWCVERGIAL